MKYMMLIYMEESAMNEAERHECYQKSTKLVEELHAKAQHIASAPLHPVATATSLRVRNGKAIVTDGPFAETREQLGGYYLIEAKDLDEAIAIASRIPPATVGTVEIRPVVDLTSLLGN